MADKKRFDIYKMITDKIVEKLEAGVNPWKKPWRGGLAGMPLNLNSKRHYRGINIFLLAMSGFDSPYWITANQAGKLCADYCESAKKKGEESPLEALRIRSAKRGQTDKFKAIQKGEESTVVVFYNFKDEVDDNGEKTGKSVFLGIRYYRVFNFAQLAPELQEELKRRKKVKVDNSENDDTLDFNPIEECEKIVDAYEDRPEVSHGGHRACYSPSQDAIRMPNKEDFHGVEEYYSTLFHEFAHSTGHQDRLNREELVSLDTTFGSEKYSKEELTAEMSAAMLCGVAGIENATIDNSAAYLKSWADKLKQEDNAKLVVHAAQAAQKASDWILKGLESEDESEDANAEKLVTA